jgi:hypothetical protein
MSLNLSLIQHMFDPALSMTHRPPIVTIQHGWRIEDCQPSPVEDFMRLLDGQPRDVVLFMMRTMFDHIGRHDLALWVAETWTYREPCIEDAIAVLEETSVYFRGRLFDSMRDALMLTYMRPGMVAVVENLCCDTRAMGIIERDGPRGPTSVRVGDRLCPWKDEFDPIPSYRNVRSLFDRGEDGEPGYGCFFLDFDNDDFRIVDIIAIRVAAAKIIAAMRMFVRMKRIKACRLIQFRMRPWLDKPKCADGTVGIRLRISLRHACADGVVKS